MKIITHMTALLLCMVALAACKSAIVSPEGTPADYSTVQGTLTATLEGTMPEVVAATNATLEDLELVAVESTVDKLKGKITARMAVGTHVTIGLRAVDFDSTTVRIKVGTFGDRTISLQIFRNIERRLGATEQ